MKLKQLVAISLSIFALSAYADSSEAYSLDSSGHKTLIDPDGKEIAQLDDNIEELCAVKEYKGKLIVMSELDFGEMTTIIDAKEGEVLDSFTHFYLNNPWSEKRNALVSPSGRYIIFRKFHSAFAPEVATSNFAMIYDLEKSPAENRVKVESSCSEDDLCSDDGSVAIGKVHAGNFFFPANEDLMCSTCSPYKTQVEDDAEYLYILGNRWDAPKTVLQLSYTKAGTNDFMILEETDEGLTQKILKFKDAKLFDADGKALEYSSEIEDKFYMVDFSIEGNTLTIINLKDSSPVAKMIFEL